MHRQAVPLMSQPEPRGNAPNSQNQTFAEQLKSSLNTPNWLNHSPENRVSTHEPGRVQGLARRHILYLRSRCAKNSGYAAQPVHH